MGHVKPQSSSRIQVDFSPVLQQPSPEAAALLVALASAPSETTPTRPGAPTAPSTASPGNGSELQTLADASGHESPQPTHSQTQSDAAPVRTTGYNEWLLPCYIIQADAVVDSDRLSNLARAVPDAVTARDSSVSGLTLQGLVSADSSSCSYTCQGGLGSAGARTGSGNCGADYVLHVAITTCAVAPELHLSSPQLPRPTGKNYWVLDFGALPVGERVMRNLVLQNTGECCVM